MNIFFITVPVGCTNYSVLSEPDRHTSYERGEKSDASLVTDWYRFQSDSYIKMQDYCVSHHRCRTDITGWLNGLHPSLEEGVVNRQACFHGYYNCCYRRVQIQVRSCEGFYVYYLNPSPAGSFRYCAIAWGGRTVACERHHRLQVQYIIRLNFLAINMFIKSYQGQNYPRCGGGSQDGLKAL